MTEEETSAEAIDETEFIDPFAELQEDNDDSILDQAEDNTEVTIWAPEPGPDSDAIVQQSVDEWIESVNFTTTEDVPIPDRLVDQVIGQEAGSVVIKKAAEQRRHMLMIGDPGTGKSMLARSMTELLPKDALEDVLVYPNEDDENEL